jgi:N-acetylated-alpha-linked acidic dipeptidase
VETYDIYFNYPLSQRVALLDSKDRNTVLYEAKLKEDELKEDPTSSGDDLVPIFHGYGASGNVTGEVVYANYGTKQDYDALVDAGVDLTDKVVIVRYGKIFRGLKVKFAQDLGAAGVIIYSDPGDDFGATEANGFKPYPHGPARQASSVQRGSVQFLSLGPGDPTTPGYPSKGDALRQDPSPFIPSIPSIPLSYQDALPILKSLNGRGIPAKRFGSGWSGELAGIDYSTGPSKEVVLLDSAQDYDIRPAWNVIAKYPGVISTETIIIGNHRDSWIKGGAADPNSGSAVILEIARAFNEMIKLGWRPKRNIVFASWDGEEYGLLGSTEWGEDHAKYLDAHCIAYLNIDVAAQGTRFGASSSPLLHDMFYKVSKLVNSPKKGFDKVWDQWTHDLGRSDHLISNLGSGSDYTVFQDHLGIPSLDMGFRASKGDPVYHYHSNYDSFYWMDTFGDPSWEYHATIAKLIGLTALHLSESELIPFKTESYAELLKDYVKSLEDGSAFDVPDDVDADNYTLQKVLAAPTPDVIAPLRGLRKDIEKFQKAARKFDKYLDHLKHQYTKDYPWYKYPKKFIALAKIKVANIRLVAIERHFKYEAGLNDRPWFKHIVFAPGRYTGYAGQILPGLTEAVEDSNHAELQKWVSIIKEKVATVTKIIS